MDGEGMMRTEAMHKASFYEPWKRSAEILPEYAFNGRRLLHKNAKTCTCPDAPCRFPDQCLFPLWKPMECWSCRFVRQNHLDYYYGPGKIACIPCCLVM